MSRTEGRSIKSCWRCERAREELLEKDDPFRVAEDVWVLEEGA